jgi:hypothetical protein
LDIPISSFSVSNPGAQLRLGDQLIRYDRARTQEGYASMTQGGAEDCGCSYCRNFIAQRETAYPPNFTSLLDQLGIDFKKEGEIYECGDAGDGKRNYGGWFFFCGQILDVGDARFADSGVEYWIASGRNLPAPSGDFGLDLLAVDFVMTAPWVLSEEP